MAAAVQEQADSSEETTLPFYTLPSEPQPTRSISLSSSKRVCSHHRCHKSFRRGLGWCLQAN